MGSKLLKGISHQYFVSKTHIFDHAICFMIQHSIVIELIFSVKTQLKTPTGTLGGTKTHYKLDGPKIIHISIVSTETYSIIRSR